MPSLGCSDHLVLLFDFLCDYKEVSTGKTFYRYNKCDLRGFSDEWNQTNWQELFESGDVDEMWNIFSQIQN